MAKRKSGSAGVNVSEAIRQAWDSDRSAKPAAVVESLKGQGIKTNAGTVATTLSAYRKKLGLPSLRGKTKGRRMKRRTALAPAVSSAANGHSVSHVLEALKLVTKAKELVGQAGLKELCSAV